MRNSDHRESEEELNRMGVEEYTWMEGVFADDLGEEVDMESRIAGGRLAEGAFAQNHSLESVEIPEGVTDIGEVAFFGCRNLRSVKLPQSLRQIREEAFGESGLESITIPEGVELIEEKAFFSCHGLRRIEVLSERVTINVDAFGDCPLLLEGYVACGYPQKYNPPEELLYTLLWCTCPERHKEETSEHARKYISDNEELIMERIFKSGNAAALNGISKLKLLRQENINRYVAIANEDNQTELIALLLASVDKSKDMGDFEL